jgi:membrane fusion protein (multidrug efflux system)
MTRAALALSTLLATLATACHRPPGPEAPGLPTASVRLVAPRRQVQRTRVPATVEAKQRATLSTRVPARVERVRVRAGDRVRAGEVLASLADDDLRAQLAGAQVVLSRARLLEQRLRRLAAEGAATRTELDAAQAKRAEAEAAVSAASEALSYTELRSPFDALVQAKRVTAGDLVMPGEPLLELEGSGLELLASLSGDEVARVRVGDDLLFESGAAGGRAELSSIAPSADPVAHRVEVRARVLRAPPGLRGGSFARLWLPAAPASPPEPWVPTSALVQRGDLRGVFVARDGRAELRWLLLGDAVDGAAPVRAGLGPGERIVEGPRDLRDGQPIRVVDGG